MERLPPLRIVPRATLKGQTMLKVITLATVSALALAVTFTAQPAQAGNGGAIAAGVVGGLAVGAIVGSQANRSYYGGPGYYDSGYQPVYGACHTERQQVVDAYGRYRTVRVRVCD
jgi:hypothetical protein